MRRGGQVRDAHANTQASHGHARVAASEGLSLVYSSQIPLALRAALPRVTPSLTDSASQYRMDVDCDDAPFELI